MYIENGGIPMTKKYQPVGVGMTPSKTELGKFIRDKRIKLGLSQVSLNREIPRSGGKSSLIGKIEIGSRTFLGEDQLDALAKALQIETEEIRRYLPVTDLQPRTELGRIIRSRREEIGLSISDFANGLGITPKEARRFEMRSQPSIRHNLLKPLARILNMEPSAISKFAGYKQRQTKSELGNIVRMRRRELGMSMNKLAGLLGVKHQYVYQIEFGLSPLNRNGEMVKRLAQFLEIDVDVLEDLRPKIRLKKMRTTSPLGMFLYERRSQLSLTQKEVGERLGKVNSVVSCIENGRRNINPDSDFFKKLEEALECKIPMDIVSPSR